MPKFDLKKLLLIILFLVLVAGIGYLLYKYLFTAKLSTTTPPTEIVDNRKPLPTAGDRTEQQDDQEPVVITDINNITDDVNQISDDNLHVPGTSNTRDPEAEREDTFTNQANNRIAIPEASNTISPTLSGNGSDVQFYNSNDKRFYKITKDNKITELSKKNFYNVDNVTWSPVENKAILEYPDQSKTIYNFDTDKQITLPSHWEEFDFSPSGEQIAFKSMGLDPENRWLAIVNSDGTKSEKIEVIGTKANEIMVSWSPNNQVIALNIEGADFSREYVYFIGKNKENFKATLTQGRGFSPLWSPQGDKIVYSIYDNTNNHEPSLWIVDAQGDNIGNNRRPLNLGTLATKCSFVNDTEVYCAVPTSLPVGSGLYTYLLNDIADDIYKINITNNTKTLIDTNVGYNVSNIIVTEDEEYLYFTDMDSSLHRIEL